MKKKKHDEKKARLLSELETNDLHMKRIDSNVCKLLIIFLLFQRGNA